MLTSIKSVNLFLGANSSRNTPAATAIGKDKIRVINKVKKVPITEPKIPACSGSVESAFKKKFLFKPNFISPFFSKLLNQPS